MLQGPTSPFTGRAVVVQTPPVHATGFNSDNLVAGYGRKQVAEMLLKAGSDIHCKNKDAQTPLDAAKINKEQQLVELLEDWISKHGNGSTPADSAGTANGHAAKPVANGHSSPVLSKPT